MPVRTLRVVTPWDHSSATITVDMLAEDIKQLQEGRCFNGICRNGWDFLVASGRMNRIKRAFCWTCAEWKYCKGILSGCPAGTFYFIENGKIRFGKEYLGDVDDLVDAYRSRIKLAPALLKKLEAGEKTKAV